jgi:hypothetical protein
MPTKEDLFTDARSYSEYGERLELLKSALRASIDRHDRKIDYFVAAKQAEALGLNAGIQRGHNGGVSQDKLMEAAARLAEFTKGLTGTESAQVSEDLAALRGMIPTFAKDISTTVPGNLHPYDLEAPAKVLVPRFTPLRNRITRTRAQGTAREYRRILGYTNAGMGGVADISPFFSSETALNGGSTAALPSFGALQLIRGQKISYAMDVHTLAYQEMSLSDSVGWKAQFANLGFEDARQLSTMALLWAHLLGEEKAILYGRGASASGYEGPVAAPVASVANAATGGSIPAATYFVKVTARAGYGESVVSGEVSTTTTGSTSTITVTVTTEPVGALGYNLYVGTSTGTEKFIQSFVGNSVTLTSYVAGSVNPPGADSTANAFAYDGYLTVLADPAQSGYVNRLNAPLWNGSTGSGDKAFQDAFASLFASVYADPEEVWLAAPQRRELSDWIKAQAGGAAGYRLMLSQGEFESGTHISGIVSGIVNESSPTGRITDLVVHPYMPSGSAFINSRVLPIPDSHIGETVEMLEVQPYMSVDWPTVQFTWDASTYWYGSLCHYAPKWSGAILGIQ